MVNSRHVPSLRRWGICCQLVSLFAFLSASVSAQKVAADYFVRSLPGQPDGPLLRMHAGHIEVTPEHHGNLFFWRFENRHLANRHRTVLWLNGGPGCSSEDGALMEVGPYRVTEGGKLTYNEGSWDEFANLLFVDNPVGTGFSFVDTNSYIHELHTMAENMVTFLQKYYELFPQEQGNDLYIAGESYAGQHIPYIAKAILDRNKGNLQKPWNLKGLLIGNGWISPKEQGLSYLTYAYDEGLVQKGTDIGNKLDSYQQECKATMDMDTDENRKVQYSKCEKILSSILELTKENGRCTNMYDIRKDDTYPSCGMNWPPDLAEVTPYLRKREVIQALHVDSGKKSGWTECNGAVGGAFHPTDVPAISLLPDLLEEVPVLLFSGDRDLICNHVGTEDMIKNMEWNGGKGFEVSPGQWAPRRDWTFEDEPAGFYQEARNLTYVLFYNSSHMVPFDYPRRTRDMLDRFMGVDIASIGGIPANSLIDGEKGIETSVGGHPNSTAAEEEKEKELEDERWSAYYRSGAVALVVVAILAAAFGWYVWQDRRRRAGYRGIMGDEGSKSTTGLMRRDVEAADFDESELDNLSNSPRPGEDNYSLGGSSDDEDDMAGKKEKRGANGHANGYADNEDK